MKNSKFNITLILILTLSSTLLFAASGYNVNFSQPMNSEINLDFDLNNYKVEQITKNGVTYSTINFENSVTTKKKGFAELPFIHAAIQLSNTRNITTEIIVNDYVEYQLRYPLLPSRGTIYRDQDPSSIPYEIANESLVDKFYPENIAEAMEPFIIRDVRGTIVYVYPFQYNAEKNTLRVYENITVKLTENNSTPVNPIYNAPQRITKAMNSLYRTVFINYTETRFEHELDEFGSILVIHTPRDAAAILPYIEWKREKGFIVYVEEVTTGTNVTSLVSSQYASHNDILYVQLVGDWADIQGTTSGGAAADPNLGCVVGGDAYPDLIVGRFSAGNADQVTTQVNKAIGYEKTPEIGGDWYSKGLGIGSSGGPGDDGELDYVHIDVIKDDKLLPFTYTEVAEAYQYPSQALVSGPVNDGLTIINYCGHGSTTSWVTSGFNNTSVNNLSNGDKLPFIISVACVNGNFQSTECFAEAWLHKSGGGAVGMYASTINQSWDPPMRGQDYINDLLIGGYDYAAHPGQNGITTDVQKTTYGAVCLNGSILMVVEDYSTGLDEMQHWTIFGDAALQVRTDTPQELLLSNTAVLMGIDFTTTITSGGTPVEGAMVALSQDGEVFSGISDSNGNVTISHDLTAGICTMVVTGFNTETIYDDNVAVVPSDGPYVIFDSCIIDDSNGNNNNLLDYGESVLLDITLSNVGTVQADNVDATLSTTDQYVTILDDSQNFGNIPAGQTVTQNGAFAFEVSGNVPDGHGIFFTLETTDATYTWVSTFIINAHAPVMEIGNYLIDDTAQGNGDYFWDAGETVDIFITVENNGSSDAFNVIGELLTADQYITINSNQADYGDIALGESSEGSFNATSSPSTPQAHMAIFNVAISSDGGVTGSGSFDVQIGDYLIEEYFDGGTYPPTDWSISGSNPGNWSSSGTANAGGSAPESKFSWSPSFIGESALTSPVINTTGSASLALTYKHFLNDWSGNGYSIGVKTTSDGGSTWNTVYEVFPTGNIGPEILEFTVETSDVGSPTFQIAFFFDGNSYNLDYYYIDDIILGGGPPILGYIEGNVSLNGGTGNILDVIVNAGGITTNPDASGNYTLEVVPGTYNVTASLEDYITQTAVDVEVLENSTTENIDFVLEPGSTTNDILIPVRTELTGNYPNPFNPTTNIKFSLKADSKVSLSIYNIRGQKVKTLVKDNMLAGWHSIVWNGKDDNGKSVSSGVYFSRFDAADDDGDYTSIKKMILLK